MRSRVTLSPCMPTLRQHRPPRVTWPETVGLHGLRSPLSFGIQGSPWDPVSISQPPCCLAPQQPQHWATCCPCPQRKNCRRHVSFAFASGLGNLLPLLGALLPDPAYSSKSGGSSSRWAQISWGLWQVPPGASAMARWPQRRGDGRHGRLSHCGSHPEPREGPGWGSARFCAKLVVDAQFHLIPTNLSYW